jgi:hypothetical protein
MQVLIPKESTTAFTSVETLQLLGHGANFVGGRILYEYMFRSLLMPVSFDMAM